MTEKQKTAPYEKRSLEIFGFQGFLPFCRIISRARRTDSRENGESRCVPGGWKMHVVREKSIEIMTESGYNHTIQIMEAVQIGTGKCCCA